MFCYIQSCDDPQNISYKGYLESTVVPVVAVVSGQKIAIPKKSPVVFPAVDVVSSVVSGAEAEDPVRAGTIKAELFQADEQNAAKEVHFSEQAAKYTKKTDPNSTCLSCDDPIGPGHSTYYEAFCGSCGPKLAMVRAAGKAHPDGFTLSELWEDLAGRGRAPRKEYLPGMLHYLGYTEDGSVWKLLPKDPVLLEQAKTDQVAMEVHNREQAANCTKPKSLKILYIPKGPAGEYSSLAFNPWIGCKHSCRYQHYKDQMACYAPSAFHKTVDQFHIPELKTDMLQTLEGDLKLLVSDAPLRAKFGNGWVDVSLSQRSAPVFMMFGGDLYSTPSDHDDLPRKILELFNKYKVPFDVLTKAGTKAVSDFDLYTSGCRFWTTLTFDNPEDSKTVEPGATLPEDRIAAMQIAHERDIKTCVSMEPVLDDVQALHQIDLTHEFVDLYWIGKLNHNRELENAIDWQKFRADVETKLKGYGKNYKIKQALLDVTTPIEQDCGSCLAAIKGNESIVPTEEIALESSV